VPSIKYTTADGRMTFEFDATSPKDVFAQLAEIQDVFEERSCGSCCSERIRFDVREFDGNSYYKMVCRDCAAQLDYGQHKTGDGLFPKRHQKDTRDPLPNGGWYHWQGRDEQAPQVPAARKPEPPRSQPQWQRVEPPAPARPEQPAPQQSAPKAAASQPANGNGGASARAPAGPSDKALAARRKVSEGFRDQAEAAMRAARTNQELDQAVDGISAEIKKLIFPEHMEDLRKTWTTENERLKQEAAAVPTA
jgi:hypothetical protein